MEEEENNNKKKETIGTIKMEEGLRRRKRRVKEDVRRRNKNEEAGEIKRKTRPPTDPLIKSNILKCIVLSTSDICFLTKGCSCDENTNNPVPLFPSCTQTIKMTLSW